MNADGSGTYTNFASATGTPAEQAIHVGSATLVKLTSAFATARTGKCETKMKNIAKTGQKTLTYRLADGNAIVSCTFNYSDSDALNGLVDALLAVAETMQAGERIAQKHRYDRLGLDAELDTLLDEVNIGRAIEIGNIAPVLESVANDERVMERAQRKAARLLQDAGVGSTESPR